MVLPAVEVSGDKLVWRDEVTGMSARDSSAVGWPGKHAARTSCPTNSVSRVSKGHGGHALNDQRNGDGAGHGKATWIVYNTTCEVGAAISSNTGVLVSSNTQLLWIWGGLTNAYPINRE